jgi:HlyD family secretion protein
VNTGMNTTRWIGRTRDYAAALVMIVVLVSCEDVQLAALGQLQSERVELVAESGEPIIAIAVSEGDLLEAGDRVLSQDSERVALRKQALGADVSRLEALLDEQIEGVRSETIDVARAQRNAAEIEIALAEKTVRRAKELLDKDLVSEESVDIALRNLASIRAQLIVFDTRIVELSAGTRVQKIRQTRAQIEGVRVQIALADLEQQRLVARAPASSLVDSLPFEVGERPRVGDVVAVLLKGDQPLARVFIPEAVRSQLAIGTELKVYVDSLAEPVHGTILRIESDAAFTPYFALSEQDRGRLSYAAEIALDFAGTRLPEGIPVQVPLDQFVVLGAAE